MKAGVNERSVLKADIEKQIKKITSKWFLCIFVLYLLCKRTSIRRITKNHAYNVIIKRIIDNDRSRCAKQTLILTRPSHIGGSRLFGLH